MQLRTRIATLSVAAAAAISLAVGGAMIVHADEPGTAAQPAGTGEQAAPGAPGGSKLFDDSGKPPGSDNQDAAEDMDNVDENGNNQGTVNADSLRSFGRAAACAASDLRDAKDAFCFWSAEGWPQQRQDIVSDDGKWVSTGGMKFQNRERKLPDDSSANYHEYDTFEHAAGARRDANRIVVDLNNTDHRWYTTDHYRNFTAF